LIGVNQGDREQKVERSFNCFEEKSDKLSWVSCTRSDGVMGFNLQRSARFAAALATPVLTVWFITALESGVMYFKNGDAEVSSESDGEAAISVESESFYALPGIVDADVGTSVAENKLPNEQRDDPEAAATASPLRSQVLPSVTP